MGEKPSVFIREATGLIRQLTARDVIMFNILNMGMVWAFLYIFFAGSLYPGVNVPLTVLVALVPNLIIALLYYYLTISFPRTGGDYVWVSRLLHPAIGFMMSFALAVFFLSFIGSTAGWFTTYGLSTIFTNLAVVTGDTGYLALASAVTTQNSVFLGDLVVLVVIVGAAAVGLRNTWRYQWAAFSVVSLAVLVFLVAMLTSSAQTFKANFDALSGAKYDDVINAAAGAGLSTGFTWDGTIVGSLFSFLIFLGYWWSSYVAGEVKQSERSQLIGILGSVLLFAVIVFLVFSAPYLIAGGQFMSAASQLAASGNSAWSVPSPPVTDFLVVFANPSPIVAILVPLGIIASVFGALETIVVAVVRMIFAWSFDGIVPTRLSSVSQKRGSPNNALIVVAIAGLVYILIAVFQSNVLTFLAYATSGILIAIAFVGISAIVFPYRRRDLFMGTTPSAQRKIGGVPVIVILGVITVLTAGFVGYSAASPAFTLSPVNPIYLLALVGVFIVGLVIYAISNSYNKSRGVSLSLRFKEIPPE